MYDFGSGLGGNAIQFLIEHERIGFAEAVRLLAKKHGIEIEFAKRYISYLKEHGFTVDHKIIYVSDLVNFIQILNDFARNIKSYLLMNQSEIY